MVRTYTHLKEIILNSTSKRLIGETNKARNVVFAKHIVKI